MRIITMLLLKINILIIKTITIKRNKLSSHVMYMLGSYLQPKYALSSYKISSQLIIKNNHQNNNNHKQNNKQNNNHYHNHN